MRLGGHPDPGRALASAVSIRDRLLPILLPLLVNVPFWATRGLRWELFDAVVGFDQYNYRPYVVVMTSIGSVLLPGVSIRGYARWVVGERQVDHWTAARCAALVAATAAVMAQCGLSTGWTVESPLTRWWSLLLLFGVIIWPVVGLLAPVVTAVFVGRWAFGQLRRALVQRAAANGGTPGTGADPVQVRSR
jgi:hypothetical protein